MASKFLKLFCYRGEDVVKMRSENGKIESFPNYRYFMKAPDCSKKLGILLKIAVILRL